METRVIDLACEYERGVREGMRSLSRGDVFAIPTETVYGLAANALKPEAVRDIFHIKGRPGDNPLIVHIATLEMAFELARVTREAERLAEVFWPGPLTMVLPKRKHVPYEVTAGLQTVGLRMPAQPAVLEIINQTNLPIAAPSANKSGRPSPTTAQRVYEDFQGEIPLILDDGPCDIGLESTVVLLLDRPTIVRPGLITPQDIMDVLGDVVLDDHVLSIMSEDDKVLSPGMKYRHYAPRAHAVLVDGDEAFLPVFVLKEYERQIKAGKQCLIFATEETSRFYAAQNYVILGNRKHPETLCRSFYDALRMADDEGYDEIIIEGVALDGAGLAFMNRALRTTAFQVIQAGPEA